MDSSSSILNTQYSRPKKIAILGCGAIGGLFLGRLSQKGYDVLGVVRDYQKEPLLKEGLVIEGVKEKESVKVKADTKLTEKVDLAIFATKINDLKEIIEQNIECLREATILSTQNGVKADYILSEYFAKDKIITSIVMFGATFYPPNKVLHNFEGNLILGNIFGEKVTNLDEIKSLLQAAFNTLILDDIKGAKYLKLLVNLNNCIPACLGLSMQEVFSDLEIAKLAIKLNKEAYEVIANSGINLVSLPNYPKDRIEGLVTMDLDAGAGLFSKIMVSLSKEPLYGSILQSIKRGRLSEIDYINGEIVKLTKDNNLEAPLNEKIIEAVHRVEKTGEFFTKKALNRYLEG